MNRSYGLHVLIILFVAVAFACVLVYPASQAQTEKSAARPAATPTPSPTPEVVDEDDEPLKIEADLVNVLFTAADTNKRFITDLKKEDVRILEDGQPQQIFTFYRQVDLPLSLAILIDTSISQERTLPEEKEAAKAFLNDVVRQGKDEVAILSFTGDTTLEQGLTGNIQRLGRAVDRVEFVPPSGYIGRGVVTGPGGGAPGTPPINDRAQQTAGSTAIWDAIWVSSNDVLRTAPQGTRRAIILITDGDDTSSSKKFGDAIDAATRSDALIYCIGIGDDFYRGVMEPTLRKLSDNTGGRAFFPRNELELQHAFTQIQLDLRSQYLLAYEPTNPKKDGTYRKIQIEVTNPTYKKAKLVHRQGYFAQTEGKTKK
jgi:Ca-activated chloride channel family protein